MSRSIARSSYRTLLVSLVSRSGKRIGLTCYCRYASSRLQVALAVRKLLERSGYAGVVGIVQVSRLFASYSLTCCYSLNCSSSQALAA